MRIQFATVAAAVVVAGCAASPAAVAPALVSSEPYRDLKCSTLADMQRAKQADIDKLYKSQSTKRWVDGVSNVVLLPGVASVVKDSSKPLAQAKGEMQAMIREYDRRCLDE